MAKQLPKDKPDYSLAIRYMRRDGKWSEWINKGYGKFLTIEVVQLQMRMLASAYPNHEKQIEFKWNGKLCDFNGKETGKLIELK
ncbi:MAG: hypothetical protein RIR48_133 [Bacteroidota bacterium]|jgi:hypothetical protein